MRKIIVILVGLTSFLLLTAGRCTLEDACATETALHQAYVFWVAPHRPADKVAKELKLYNTVMALCAAGAPPSQIEAAQANSSAARSQ